MAVTDISSSVAGNVSVEPLPSPLICIALVLWTLFCFFYSFVYISVRVLKMAAVGTPLASLCSRPRHKMGKLVTKVQELWKVFVNAKCLIIPSSSVLYVIMALYPPTAALVC